MDQTMAVGPGIYALNGDNDDDDMQQTMTVPSSFATANNVKHSNEILADLHASSPKQQQQQQEASLSPLALLSRLDDDENNNNNNNDDDVVATPHQTGKRVVHTPGTAAQLALGRDVVEVAGNSFLICFYRCC
jgi:hypothetical protein